MTAEPLILGTPSHGHQRLEVLPTPTGSMRFRVFDASDDRGMSTYLDADDQLALCRFLGGPIPQAMEKALRACLLPTAAYVGPGHIKAYNQVREALRLIDGEDGHRTDPPEAREWLAHAADNERLRSALRDCVDTLAMHELTGPRSAHDKGVAALTHGQEATQ